MIRRPPRSTLSSSSAASDVYKRQYQRRVREARQPIMSLVVCDPSGARAAQHVPPEMEKRVQWGFTTDQEVQSVLAVAEQGQAVEWSSLLAALQMGGSLTLVCDQDDAKGNGAGLTAMISGFNNVAAETISEGVVRVTASRPEYTAGAKANISRKPNPFAAGANDGEEIMDEDSLLTAEEIAAKPELPACGPKSKGRRACKNCSCGFAAELEAEKKGELKAGDQPLYKSACGSCYKGDAFRCADCPYRGMAAFEPGEKVELNMEDDL
eukprot:TRINITY_DN14754_c0_g1_i2.p1 TRINITY_DN14754_c0_g1~~TRINITY_DN14754_c0_g1_i2.p1  ORF type:complete len:267 (-),score=68.21 TRINITY_DN14754_c0_g1_i2:367-1167(-)